MLPQIKLILTLAVLYLITAPTLLMIEHSMANIVLSQVALQLVLLSVFFFTFTIVELLLTEHFKSKDSSYFIGVNLGFSLFRLLLTLGFLLYFRAHSNVDFLVVFINVLTFYFITLLFSTWCRQRGHKKNYPNETSSQTSSQ